MTLRPRLRSFGPLSFCKERKALLALTIIFFEGTSCFNLTGAVYLHDCDIEDNVPIFLIVSGVVSILFGGSAKQNNQASNDGRGRSNYGCVDICKGIIFLFSLAWLIAGKLLMWCS